MAARRFAGALAVAAVGIVIVALAHGTLEIIGWAIVGLAAVIAVSLVFLEIGLSEDRDRRRRPGG